MANITKLIDGVWTGGDLPAQPTAAAIDIAAWMEAGITHVVDNRIEWNDQDLVALVAPEITYLHNGVDDAGQDMSDE